MNPAIARSVARSDLVPDDAPVLPEHITAASGMPGPRFGEPEWNFRPFLPRSHSASRIMFSTVGDPITVLVLKEYLYSRLRRGNTAMSRRGPLKLTHIFDTFAKARAAIATLTELGAPRLADVTQDCLDTAMARWRAQSPEVAAMHIRALKHLFAHGPFLSADRLQINPWRGRSAHQLAGLKRQKENTTERIPEHIIGPLLKAAVFYVETAAGDILAAQAELKLLQAEAPPFLRNCPGEAGKRLQRFIDELRAAGRGVPAQPVRFARKFAPIPVVNGVLQRPNFQLSCLLAGIRSCDGPLRQTLIEAGDQLGYQAGGLRTPMSAWPPTGQPWREPLGPEEIAGEITYLRVACWVVIAYLSGMRDAEVRELAPDCAFTEPGPDGRTRYKIRGRVLKHRKLTGDLAEWVVLPVVHTAIDVLRQINDDPTHLMAHTGRTGRSRDASGLVLFGSVNLRLNNFRDHLNRTFRNQEEKFIPDVASAAGEPWRLNARQFRRTLAWHIAHQPFGVVAGSRQYQHAELAVFEGYAGTSESGFAAEVESQRTVAKLDYVEDLYCDWNTGHRSGGGAAARVSAEFARIRRECE